MENINMSDTVSSELSRQGVSGRDKMNVLKNYQNEENETTGKTMSPISYLKDGVKLSDIYILVKNKKLSNNKIKNEIRKLLKDPNDLVSFLTSLLRNTNNKSKSESEETNEETGSGSAGGFSGPLFSSLNENDLPNGETTEATTTASSGSYETPAFLAKNKKNWRGGKKPLIPGGKFVKVKGKCKKFPYCNQGDINALKIFENETLSNVIKNISEKYSLHEDHIKTIILKEFGKLTK